MKHLDLNTFMMDVHQNAVSHGWWENQRTPGTIRSLFHCELSEAVEEYRKNEPDLYHKCAHGGICEYQNVHMGEFDCSKCTPELRKPEGAAVELMDFVIRVLDYLAHLNEAMPASMNTAQKLCNWALDDYQDDLERNLLELDVPDFADVLHDEVSLSSVMKNITYLTTACGLAMAWVEHRGLDPVEILLEKHRYNLTRSYKHGGKQC